MKNADLPRSTNRALVDELFNGGAPYSERQAEQRNIDVNYNDLTATKVHRDACSQAETAVFAPSQYFSVKVDRGPRHKREEWSQIITSKWRRAMKDGASGLKYYQHQRNVIAQVMLHGIGPMLWPDSEMWCPEMQAVADVLVPSQTLLTMENLPYFAVYTRYTAWQLYRQTHGPRVDPGWDVEVADDCTRWAMQQWGRTGSTDYVYSPERWQEDIKANSGQFDSDAVPTINCWKFFALDDRQKESGWKLKIVLDTPSKGESRSFDRDTNPAPTKAPKNFLDQRGQFLYDGGKRNYAPKLSEIIHWQFGDGSVVAPFRYYSVRSLGWLLYSVCHIQNRLRCALTAAAFEACMQYFRVNNPEDAQRAIKLNLIDRGIIPDGVNFVPIQDRWKVDGNLISGVMALNRQSVADNSTAYTKNFGYGDEQGPEKTATQVTAEVNAATALVGSMLEQLYIQRKFQGREIGRRFCIKNSKDADVRKFRVECLKSGVPEEILDVDCWDIFVEKVGGNGNIQLALAQAQMVMSQYPLLDPNAQRVALRDFMFAATRDADKTQLLVPDEPVLTTKSVHDAQVSVATLLMGQIMGLVEGVSHAEYAATLLGALNVEVQKINQRGGVATMEELAGLQNLAGQTIDGQPIQGNGAANHIAILEQDKGSKQLVKQLGDLLGGLMNQVKAFAQRLQEQQGQQNGNGAPELDPETAVKLKGKLLADQAKAANMRESHAQRAEQRAEIHQQKMQEGQESAALGNAQRLRETRVEEAATDLKTAGAIQREAERVVTQAV